MSSFLDMISAFIAMLMSAAFLHFGAAGESPVAKQAPTASRTVASSAEADPVLEDSPLSASAPAKPARPAVRHLAAQCHGHGGPNSGMAAAPMVDTVRAPSPLRRG